MSYPRKPVPDDFREKYDTLRTDGALLRHYGGDMEKIARWREELGLPRKKRGADDEAFKAAHAEGLNDAALAARFGMHVKTVSRYRERLALPLNRPVHVPQHGTYGEYSDHDCRCAPCTEANRMKHSELQAIRVAKTAANGGVAPVEAHNVKTYDNWGCRCSVCYAAKQESNAEYARKRRQPAA